MAEQLLTVLSCGCPDGGRVCLFDLRRHAAFNHRASSFDGYL